MGFTNVVKFLLKNYKYVLVILVFLSLILWIVSLKYTISENNFEIGKLQAQVETLSVKLRTSEDNNTKLHETIKSNNEITEKTIHGLQSSLKELQITSSNEIEKSYNDCEKILTNVHNSGTNSGTTTGNNVGVKNGTSDTSLEKSFRDIHNSSITSWNNRLRKN